MDNRTHLVIDFVGGALSVYLDGEEPFIEDMIPLSQCVPGRFSSMFLREMTSQHLIVGLTENDDQVVLGAVKFTLTDGKNPASLQFRDQDGHTPLGHETITSKLGPNGKPFTVKLGKSGALHLWW